jgi:ribose 5-phosphate isomerase A
MVDVMAEEGQRREKKNAGHRAADLVEDGAILGLGTGSTVEYFLEKLGTRIHDGLEVAGVPTSYGTQIRARQLGIPLTTLDDHPCLDLAVDGADQVDPVMHLIKGRGGALTREKCVMAAADRVLVVINSAKLSPQLDVEVPVEVIPFSAVTAARALQDLGGDPTLRCGIRKDGPVVTDNGNLILDCDFGTITDPVTLEASVERIPGVVCAGLFTGFGEKTRVVVGEKSGTRLLPL